MRKTMLAAVLFAATSAIGGVIDEEGAILRGDANTDGSVDGSDPQFILNWLWLGGPEPACLNDADANHDGYVDNSDAVYLLDWLYDDGLAPPYPGPSTGGGYECVSAPAPSISCGACSD